MMLPSRERIYYGFDDGKSAAVFVSDHRHSPHQHAGLDQIVRDIWSEPQLAQHMELAVARL